ncbi:hypothetical protein PGT21_020011 [Puccinia graminis f. sp. tritici]|uniref:Uncharacterized protein n=1 Tax=Puccinia graminis f. sp. tritici TaxID=56615 RepID=A0A5B0MU72_PUCGR|nr:hypothetical protein PGT21_020011 [Puccinia graminis f. sp. tritici]
MTIIHKEGNLHKNTDGLSRWPLPNNVDNPAYDQENLPSSLPIMGINVTDLNEEFFNDIRDSYKQDKNCWIILQLLGKDFKDKDLSNSLEDEWKKRCKTQKWL